MSFSAGKTEQHQAADNHRHLNSTVARVKNHKLSLKSPKCVPLK